MHHIVPQGIERVKVPEQNEELLPFSWKDQAHMYREDFISKGIKIGFTVSNFPRFHFCAICPLFFTSKSNKMYTFTKEDKNRVLWHSRDIKIPFSCRMYLDLSEYCFSN